MIPGSSLQLPVTSKPTFGFFHRPNSLNLFLYWSGFCGWQGDFDHACTAHGDIFAYGGKDFELDQMVDLFAHSGSGRGDVETDKVIALAVVISQRDERRFSTQLKSP